VGGGVAAFHDGADDFGLGVGDGAVGGFDDGFEGGGAVLVEEVAEALFGFFGDPLAPVEGFAFLHEFDDVAFDGGFGHIAGLGDFGDGEAVVEEAEGDGEGFAAGAGDGVGLGVGGGEGAGVVVEEASDDGEEGLAVLIEFGLADAGEGGEGVGGVGEAAGHGAEGAVAEDDVGGDFGGVGEFLAELTEGFEELGVVGFLGDAAVGALGGEAFVFEEIEGALAVGEVAAPGGEAGDGVGVVGEGEEVLGEEGVGEASPPGFGVGIAGGVGGELVVLLFADAGGVGSGEDIAEVDEAEALAGVPDGGEEEAGIGGGVGFLVAAGADIAGAAVFVRVVLAEVAEDGVAAAGGGGGEAFDVAEEAEGALAFGVVGDLVDEVAVFLSIAAGVEEEAVGGLAVAAGAAGFLVVAFEVFGEVAVDDEADVWFVDAHAEGDGGDDDGAVVADEGFLGGAAFGGLHAGVVAAGGDVVFSEEGDGCLDAAAGGAVDDAGLAGAFAEEADHLGIAVGFTTDFVEEVGAVEGGADADGIVQGEAGDDVLGDAFGGGGGEGGEGDLGEGVAEGGEDEVVGAEVVAPFGEAVGLVDGEGGGGAGGAVAEFVEEAVGGEAFGGEVEEVEGAGAVGPGGVAAGVEGLAAVDAGGADAVGAGGVDLVLHEGDEGADDDHAAVLHDGGELEAEGLSAAGGHEGEDVAAIEEALHGLFLVGAELVVAEDFGEDLAGVVGHGVHLSY